MSFDLSEREKMERMFARHGVVLAYLFGSQAEGKAGPLSDVDIAGLLGPQVPEERWTQVQIDLINDLIGLFHRDDVDVTLLNRATPVLAQEVVRSGQVIYEAEPGARIDFQVAALRRYVDTEPLRRLQNRRLLERVESYRSVLEAQGR
ncbi:MAG: nucleotidyltransferase domain-containing protein [Anaerolineae bacterium]|nr:nucleotidyltransferase domain-containing protein [Anaerolineae bacterium]